MKSGPSSSVSENHRMAIMLEDMPSYSKIRADDIIIIV